MSDPLLIYGATGYTGGLMVEGALAAGLRPIVAGRDPDKVRALGDRLGLESRAASLADESALDAALRDVRVVLHAAGPYSGTARPMVDACLRGGAHYLDITGEIPVIEALAGRHADARQRGIMIMPAVGFDVVPSDCLVAHVARRVPGARHLALGITGHIFATRASAKTLVEHAFYGVQVRRGGRITSVPSGELRRDFDFGNGAQMAFAVCWGDVATAWYTTGIPDIEVYFEAIPTLWTIQMAGRYFGWFLRTAPWQVWLKAHADVLPEGPSAAERAAVGIVLVAEVEDGRGRRASARMRTHDAYTVTRDTGPAIAARILAGDFEPGFQTPGRVYGPDFVLGFDGVAREDLT